MRATGRLRFFGTIHFVYPAILFLFVALLSVTSWTVDTALEASDVIARGERCAPSRVVEPRGVEVASSPLDGLEPQDRIRAIAGIAAQHDEASADELIAAAYATGAAGRVQAVLALAERQDVLVDLLGHDADAEVRRIAARVVRDRDALLEAARTDPDRLVRRNALRSLAGGAIEEEAATALAEIAASDVDPVNREVAREAIR